MPVLGFMPKVPNPVPAVSVYTIASPSGSLALILSNEEPISVSSLIDRPYTAESKIGAVLAACTIKTTLTFLVSRGSPESMHCTIIS